MTGLSLSQVSKTYDGARYVLDCLNLDVAQGELVSLLGPSGCGKSTALRIIGGLIPASSGRITVAGRDVGALPSHARNMGLVFQNYALFPHLSVAANVAFGLEMRGVARQAALHQAEAALEMVRLGGLGPRLPRQLSGGQQQRVALARALVIRPDLLLLDEPLSNLDAQLREQMRVEIRDLQKQSGITTVFVTHDQAEALAMSDRVAILDHGRVAQFGTPLEIYERPASAFVAGFIGRVNRIDGEARAAQDGLTPITSADGAVLWTTAIVERGPATVMVRPQRMRLANGAATAGMNRLAATVSSVTFAGEAVQIAAHTGSVALVLECPSHVPGWQNLAPGSAIAAEWRPEDSLAFAALT